MSRINWLIVPTLLVVTGMAAAEMPVEVVFTEGFEDEGQAFLQKWTGDAAKVYRDTAVVHGGQASLRIESHGTRNPFLLWSTRSEIEGVLGHNYRISFWVKSNDRFVTHCDVHPAAGGPPAIGGGYTYTSTLGWRKIVYGGRVGGKFVGPAPLVLKFRFVTGKKDAVLWFDDFVVEKTKGFAEDVGWTPVPEGRNLIPNGSFEVDPSRHYTQWHATNDRGPDQNWQLSTDAIFGSRSLAIREDRDMRYGHWRLGPALELTYPLAFDSADAEFTLSASVKMTDHRQRQAQLVLGTSVPEQHGKPIPPGSIILKITPTKQWTRHQKTFRLPRSSTGKYFFYIRGGGHTLFDGLMLARGKSAKFKPWHPVEATLSSDKPWRVYTPDDPLNFTLRAVRADNTASKTLELTLVNYHQVPVRQVRWQVDAEVGQVVERQERLDPLPQGCYRAELRVAGKAPVLSDLSFSVMPEPRRVPYAESNYGLDTDGLDFNTYDWDLSPMFLRLGFHWARLWSMACLEDEGLVWGFRGLSAAQGRAAGQQFVNNLKKHGFGILLSTHQRYKYRTMHGFPFPPNTEEQFADYKVHLRELADRFGDRIDYWEIGNEPNPPTVMPENYARMVRDSVSTLREIDPATKIISIAGAANGDRFWTEKAIKLGAIDGVDGISFHYGGQTGSDTAMRYRQWREWASRRKGQPLEIWDSEEGTRGPSFLPVRAQSPTGQQDVGIGAGYAPLFCRDTKIYLCNSAMNIRTIAFSMEFTMATAGYQRGFWEKGGAFKPAGVANFLAAQLIQTMKGGGFYRTPDGLFGALVHDKEQSVLMVWSEKYTGTSQKKTYQDPFDLQDQTPRPLEDLGDIPDFYRDVNPVSLKVPDGVKVLDAMGAPAAVQDGRVTVDIYQRFLVVPRLQEEKLLSALDAKQVLAPLLP